MKVAILNYSGTVGKTTIAAHLLSPRMNNAPIYAVETVNETADGFGLDIEKMKGDKFRDLFKKLTMLDDAIIDVGASNVEAFLNGMTRYEDSHLEIDRFIVPVTNGSKEQKETMRLVAMLADFGIPADKIRLLFNRVESEVEEEFTPLFNFAKKEKNCIADPNAAVYENELFDILSIKKITVGDAMSDETDYKAKAREEKAKGDKADKKMITHYLDMHSIKSGAKPLTRNLDAVFSSVMG